MREGAPVAVALPPHVVQLARGLHLAQAVPIAWEAVRGVAGGVQDVECAADAVPVAAQEQAAVLWQAGQQLVPEEGGPVGRGGRGIDCHDREGCAAKGEVNPEAAPVQAAVPQLHV